MVKKKTSILIKKHEGFRAAVKEFLERVQEISSSGISPVPLTELSSLVKKLDNYAGLLEDLNSQIEISVADTDLDAELSENQKICEAIWDGQSLAQSLLDSAIQKPTDDGKSEAGASSVSRSVRVKLPKLELCSFNGDPLRWQEFYDSFESTIHSNDEISVIDKFKYLKMYLKGDALRVVDGFRLTIANYESALEQLTESFGEPEAVKFAHFDSLLSLSVASADTRSLEDTYDQSEKHIRSLVALGLGEETFGQVFAPILLSKLPWVVRVALHRQNGSATWTLSNLRKLLGEEIQARKKGDWAMDQSKEPKGGSKSLKESKTGFNGSKFAKPRPVTTGALVQHSRTSPRCNFCREIHFSDECPKFTTLKARKNAVNGNCFKCLGKGHLANACPQTDKKCFHCGGTSHHRALCAALFKPKETNCMSPSDQQKSAKDGLNSEAQPFTPKPDITAISSGAGPKGLVQMQMAQVHFLSARIPARVFLDTGSSRSYVTTGLCRKLKLKPVGKEMIVNSRFGEAKPKVRSYDQVVINLPCHGLTGTIPVTALVTDTITGPVQKQTVDTNCHPILLKLPLADPVCHSPETVYIDILIGNDFYYQIVGKERIDLDDGLVLLESKLGYITTGVLSDRSGGSSSSMFVASLLTHSNVTVGYQNFDVERFWRLEDLGVTDDCCQKDDEVAVKSFNDTGRIVDGRYQVGWPWKQAKPQIPLSDNMEIAKGRLKSVIRGLQAKPELLQAYNSTIRGQLDSGIIELAPVQSDGELVHYLPHHCVVKPGHTTTKVRIVYDASAKRDKFDLSLNDCLLRGPVFLQDLASLLLRFRSYEVGVVADIERAFLQVGLHPSDRDVTRFLWLKDPTKPVATDNLQHYRFCRVPFGVISSPFLLDATIKHHLNQKSGCHALQLKDNMYVDNFVDGFKSCNEATVFFTEAKKLLQDISMNVREWFCNKTEFIASIPENDRGGNETTKVLGMIWDVEQDTLSYQDPKLVDFHVKTKRNLVQASSRVFDPCGLIAPALVKAKLLVQDAWRNHIPWNGKLPEEMVASWTDIASDLSSLGSLRIPRCPTLLRNVELHAFCDASGKAYAAAIYVRPLDTGEAPFLVFAKSKLAPLKAITIPRLELMAAVVGVRLLKFVRENLKVDVAATFLWSDSRCVLAWLKSLKVLTVFVQNRVNEIRQHQHVAFRHVPSEENPADLPSRGVSLESLKECNLWWHGPQFLSQSQDNWPSYPDILDNNNPIDPDEIPAADTGIGLATIQQDQLCSVPDPPFGIDSCRYSRLHSLLRVTVICQRAVKKFLQPVKGTGDTPCDSPIASAELVDAKQMWIRWAQRQLEVPKNLRKQLALFEGTDGLLRCGGRLQLAEISESAKHPILIPGKNSFARLLIHDAHTRALHSGVKHTLAALRTEYWIPHGRPVVKFVLRKCQLCQLVEGKPFKAPDFPPLPNFRVTQSEPFTYTGIDYLGPLYTRGTGTIDVSKVWICLFTCAATRAVHLEVVRDMTAKAFLLCLRRFVSICGAPKVIISDNAKQFKTGYTVLRKALAELQNGEAVQDFAADEGISWKFIPEFSSWMGGFYERLVGTVKRALKRTLFRKFVDLDELRTVVSEIVLTVNSRPLVQSESPSDHGLTPNDLLGRNRRRLAGVPAEPDAFSPEVPGASDDIINSWRRSCKLLNMFWSEWRNSYLNSLREYYQVAFSNRGTDASCPQVGDVVLIREENIPRAQWRMGVISALTASHDGQIRSATVRLTGGKSLVRPIRFLYPIETSFEVKASAKASQNTDDNGSLPDSELSNTPRSFEETVSPPIEEPNLAEARTEVEHSSYGRPRRMAARNASAINRILTVDEALNEEDEPSCPHVTNNCPAIARQLTSCVSFQAIPSTMPQQVTIRLNRNDPLGPDWTGWITEGPQSGHGPVFMLDGKTMTSISMAYWYLVLKSNGKTWMANELVSERGLQKNGCAITSWMASMGFETPATWVFQAEHVYYAIMVKLISDGNNAFAREMDRVIDQYPDSTEINFVLHSQKNDFVWSCGFRKGGHIVQEFGCTLGYNLYGHLLERLAAEKKANEYNCFYTVNNLLTNDLVLKQRPKHTLLIVSDSHCSQIESIQSSVDPIRISGGKYHDGAREIIRRGINPRDFSYIAIHFGINFCRYYNMHDWNRSWKELRSALAPAIGADSPTWFIVDSPIYHPSSQYVKEHRHWLKQKMDDIPNATFIDLTKTRNSRFVNEDCTINPLLYGRDQFHLNHFGVRALWDLWCQFHPELILVKYKLSGTKYEKAKPASVNRKRRFNPDSQDAGPSTSGSGV